MTTTRKPQNGLVESLSVDTLCNVINSLLFVNDYFLQASESDMYPEKEVLYGLGQHLDQSISALRYEKRKMSRKLKKSSKLQRTREAECKLKALNNPVTEHSDSHSPSELNQLICTAYFDLHGAQKEYYRAVESSQKEITIGGKSLPIYTQWLVDRSEHVLNALELLSDDLRKADQGNIDDEDT